MADCTRAKASCWLATGPPPCRAMWAWGCVLPPSLSGWPWPAVLRTWSIEAELPAENSPGFSSAKPLRSGRWHHVMMRRRHLDASRTWSGWRGKRSPLVQQQGAWIESCVPGDLRNAEKFCGPRIPAQPRRAPCAWTGTRRRAKNPAAACRLAPLSRRHGCRGLEQTIQQNASRLPLPCT